MPIYYLRAVTNLLPFPALGFVDNTLSSLLVKHSLDLFDPGGLYFRYRPYPLGSCNPIGLLFRLKPLLDLSRLGRLLFCYLSRLFLPLGPRFCRRCPPISPLGLVLSLYKLDPSLLPTYIPSTYSAPLRAASFSLVEITLLLTRFTPYAVRLAIYLPV